MQSLRAKYKQDPIVERSAHSKCCSCAYCYRMVIVVGTDMVIAMAMVKVYSHPGVDQI